MMEPYRGTKVVTYHKSLTYFCQRFGLEEVDTDRAEARHSALAVAHHRLDRADEAAQGVKLILMEPWHEQRTPDLVAEQTGAKVVEFPAQVGSASEHHRLPVAVQGHRRRA